MITSKLHAGTDIAGTAWSSQARVDWQWMM